MIFRSNTLDKIKNGQVTLAFRKWKKPTVKQGGTLKTIIGLLSIDEITPVQSITHEEMIQAGYTERQALEKELAKSSGEQLYRIKFHLAGEDPRIKLRNESTIGLVEFEELSSKMNRFDRSARYPGWANKTLQTIQNNPGKSAGLLSEALGIEKMWLKSNIRKLKELGMTISLEVGYRISPRGLAYLEKINLQ